MPDLYVLLILPILLLFLLVQQMCLSNVAATADTACTYLPRAEIESHLSTKTPYRAIANYNDTPLHYAGCHPTRIWSVIRHGARNPSKSVILRARQRLTDLQARLLKQPLPLLCATELERLRQWSWQHIEPDDEKLLVAEGEDELIELAERMQNRFPKLLPDLYDPSWYYMKYTATQRTLKSAQSFATGLFGRHRIGAIKYPTPLHRDPVLRFYKLCKRWQTDVDKNPETLVQARSFYQQPPMQAALQHIRRGTQLTDLEPADAALMYTVCAFETAWQRRSAPSVWCNFFDAATLQTLEFAEDLEYYWNDGYGYELTQRIACPAVADMFEAIDSDQSSARANATFYFTHSGTLLKLLAHLGLAKDTQPLTHTDYGLARRWRTSQIDAFASNLAFLRYDCENEQSPQVLVLHQERVTQLPGCPTDSDLCPLSTLRRLYAHSVEHCDFEALCRLHEHVEMEKN